MPAELSKTELGNLGETLVANWLQAQGWRQCDRQWHCRWGELDLVMAHGPANGSGQLAFVEVKTRSQGNWDAYGLMAITRSKQSKLGKAAQLYLLKHPQWAEATCRFDVALVACRHRGRSADVPDPARQLPIDDRRYLVLQDYIDNAFDGPSR
ncbi:YraN family protein [Nodosilinea nodulosa]|uniref:YraN family protein n=1 Tax=Nodosilinea nodulosa TaxID=416001 RepID=UPI00031DE1E5|nr:YraN family protein [Nodosilinea nodulosa]